MILELCHCVLETTNARANIRPAGAIPALDDRVYVRGFTPLVFGLFVLELAGKLPMIEARCEFAPPMTDNNVVEGKPFGASC
jgi:hypothetical protein